MQSAARAATPAFATAARRLFIPSLPTLDPTQLVPTLEPARPPLYPLDRLVTPAAQLFYLARAAVYHTLRHWLARPSQEMMHSHNNYIVQLHNNTVQTHNNIVLMPAYHHGVEVEAVRAAGAAIVFYRVDDDMRIDLDDLARKARHPQVRAVYVTHFVGFAQPIAAVCEIVQAHNIRIFEDCALALFSRSPDGRPLGSCGDASCYCLYKTLPLPHGGLLLAADVPTAAVVSPPLSSTLHHVAGLTLAHLELRSSGLGRALRQAARAAAHATVDRAVAMVRTGRMHLSAHELHLGASRLCRALLARIDHEMVVVRRRRNFARLTAALDGVLPVVGAPLLPGACPLFVPVRVDEARTGVDKRALLCRLHARGIDAIDFWSRGDAACDPDEFPEVSRLRRQILELPCHQALDDDDIDQVAHAVKQAVAHA
jgi:dTDP-4-amino-4,6-dideoxygalactose transaminase